MLRDCHRRIRLIALYPKQSAHYGYYDLPPPLGRYILAAEEELRLGSFQRGTTVSPLLQSAAMNTGVELVTSRLPTMVVQISF
jgi:hypothetical protein